MRRFRALAGLLAGALCLGATALLPSRVEEVARAVEQVRGKRFERTVPASEIDLPELKRILRSKVGESFPTTPADTLRTLAAFGFIENTPNLIDKLIDFYASRSSLSTTRSPSVFTWSRDRNLSRLAAWTIRPGWARSSSFRTS